MRPLSGFVAVLASACVLAACSLWPAEDEAVSGAAPASTGPVRQYQALPPPFAALTPAALAQHTQTLASDAFEGRKPATPSETKTLDYIAGQFEAAGLRPGYRGAWLQPVALLETTIDNAPVMHIAPISAPNAPLAAPPAPVGLLYGFDQIVWTKRPNQTGPIDIAGAPLVFVGYGAIAPEQSWNDYAGTDLRGAIAVILMNDPDFEADLGGAFAGKTMTYYGRWTYKLEEAARQGALGALLVHETEAAGYPWSVVQASWTGPQLDLAGSPGATERLALEGWVTREALERALRSFGLSFAALKAQAAQRGFKPIALPVAAQIRMDVRQRTVTSHNVVGVLPGRQRPDDAIVYGAHWDHLGRCPPVDGDNICNGARDNAVGVAGLIEIARRFVQDGRAERSVAFIAFTAEEQGLLGSRAYADSPVFAHGRTAAMINIDAPPVDGPTRAMTVVGAGRSDLDQRLAAVLADLGRRVEPEAHPERGGFFRSDQFSFARVGVPVLYAAGSLDLVHGGVERGRALQAAYVARGYHKPDDEFDAALWDLTGVSQDMTALYQVGRRLADSTDWPQWAPTSEFNAIRRASRAALQ